MVLVADTLLIFHEIPAVIQFSAEKCRQNCLGLPSTVNRPVLHHILFLFPSAHSIVVIEISSSCWLQLQMQSAEFWQNHCV